MLTLEQNITSVLETCFAGFKDELIKEAVKSILRLFDNQVGPPALSTNPCESGEHATSIAGEAECNNCFGYYANNYKAKSTGSPIGDYRDGVGAWAPLPKPYDPERKGTRSGTEDRLLRELESWFDQNPGRSIVVEKSETEYGPIHIAAIEEFMPIGKIKEELENDERNRKDNERRQEKAIELTDSVSLAMKRMLAVGYEIGYENGYDDACMDLLDDDLGSNLDEIDGEETIETDCPWG